MLSPMHGVAIHLSPGTLSLNVQWEQVWEEYRTEVVAKWVVIVNFSLGSAVVVVEEVEMVQRNTHLTRKHSQMK